MTLCFDPQFGGGVDVPHDASPGQRLHRLEAAAGTSFEIAHVDGGFGRKAYPASSSSNSFLGDARLLVDDHDEDDHDEDDDVGVYGSSIGDKHGGDEMNDDNDDDNDVSAVKRATTTTTTQRQSTHGE